MEYKDTPFNDEAHIQLLLARVSKENAEEEEKQASPLAGGN